MQHWLRRRRVARILPHVLSLTRRVLLTVGTIYGYILSQNANVRVTAIARSSYDAMQGGIRIESDKFGLIPAWKPYRLVRDAAAANDRTYTYIVCSLLLTEGRLG